MEFEFHFTPELEAFRREVQGFIAENCLPTALTHSQKTLLSPEMYLKGRELQRKLGKRGWFAPKYPREYGGGGLDTEHCLILLQEFARIEEEGRWPLLAEVSGIHTAGISAYGTERQKKEYLTKLLTGEWIGWQCFTEPDAGSDYASMKSTARQDGDFYIISGTKVFVGEDPIKPDYLYWLAITDPKAPRHENLSAFFIPADLPGIHCTPLNLVSSVTGQKWEVICEDVRCPAERLIGQKNQGWQVSQATLGVERGGEGSAVPRSTFVERLIDYCKKTRRHGKPLSADPALQDLLIDLYLENCVARLWGLRNFAQTKGQIPPERYTGTQSYLHTKRLAPRLGRALISLLGPYALIDDPELQLLMGEVEYQVRNCDCTHFGGTPEMQQIMMARGLGLGRAATRALRK
jgi:alkylation response protein AidB-like acyl-CoA dehydrogenase